MIIKIIGYWAAAWREEGGAEYYLKQAVKLGGFTPFH